MMIVPSHIISHFFDGLGLLQTTRHIISQRILKFTKTHHSLYRLNCAELEAGCQVEMSEMEGWTAEMTAIHVYSRHIDGAKCGSQQGSSME